MMRRRSPGGSGQGALAAGAVGRGGDAQAASPLNPRASIRPTARPAGKPRKPRMCRNPIRDGDLKRLSLMLSAPLKEFLDREGDDVALKRRRSGPCTGAGACLARVHVADTPTKTFGKQVFEIQLGDLGRVARRLTLEVVTLERDGRTRHPAPA